MCLTVCVCLSVTTLSATSVVSTLKMRYVGVCLRLFSVFNSWIFLPFRSYGVKSQYANKAAFKYRACMRRYLKAETLSKGSIFSPLYTSWMLLWRLSLVLTYLAASGTTAANLRSLFCGQKLLKLLTVGYALHEMPLSLGSKLELLWTCLLPNFRILPRILLTYPLVCVLCR